MKATESLDSEEFKKLIKEMHIMFPNSIHYEQVEKVVKSNKMREHLVDNKFLVKDDDFKDKDGKIKKGYFLGSSALPLVSAWRTEDLTERINYLTYWLIILSLVLLAITLYLNFSKGLILLTVSLIVICATISLFSALVNNK